MKLPLTVSPCVSRSVCQLSVFLETTQGFFWNFALKSEGLKAKKMKKQNFPEKTEKAKKFYQNMQKLI